VLLHENGNGVFVKQLLFALSPNLCVSHFFLFFDRSFHKAWFEPYVPVAVARFAGPAAGASWLGGSLLPATLAYTTVKGVGWDDWGNSGLNDIEMKLNGLKK